MRLSKLQKYILHQCCLRKDSTRLKVDFYDYYPKKERQKNKIAVQVGIQKSIENLVAKNLAVAYGHQTAHKWFIHKVKLTGPGKRVAKELIKSRQRRLPIKQRRVCC